MDINKITIGAAAPNEVNVLIEIPYGGAPVKYELDKTSGALFVDRFLHTSMVYPANYGFIPHTLSDDGDPVDALVLGNTPVVPGCVLCSRPIGILEMEDESGIDEKLLMVPAEKLHPYYRDISDVAQIPEITRQQIAHFFEHYKDLETGKWVKVKHWGDRQEAIKAINDGIARARNGGAN